MVWLLSAHSAVPRVWWPTMVATVLSSHRLIAVVVFCAASVRVPVLIFVVMMVVVLTMMLRLMVIVLLLVIAILVLEV